MRYLLVGLGNLGRKRQAVLQQRCVASVDPFNSAATFASPEMVPLDLFDSVILSVPNDTKVDLLRRFLGQGKHVLVEKPLLFECPEEAQQLAGLARQHGAVWYTSYNHRFEPMLVALKRHIDAGAIGQLYHARMFYGNGTARNLRGTWREHGHGVLEDLGSHLLDLAGFLLGYGDAQFLPWSLQRNELRTFDHVVLGSSDGRLMLEGSYVCWKNTFTIDMFGELGSMHLSGLAKWGPSELTVRKRVFPSGIPEESIERISGGTDPTWDRDLEQFEVVCGEGRTSADNDAWISAVLRAVAPARGSG
ncbi:MAG: Gfo/Idh/MocA family oxidoreductase [Chloroflexota bacterium]|nr:Gfo/Idh/MocA family oxidoreductase [Chloroflexota bacterium]